MKADPVGDEVRALRHAVGFTQEELAERAGTNRVDVARIERGDLKVTKSESRRKLANAFGVPFEAFDDYLNGKVTLDSLLERRTVALPEAG